MKLTTEIPFEIRFSEIDVMNVVWHGSYPLYFEDAREAFGAKYGLSYQQYINEGYFAPLVELNIQYKRPLMYGMHPMVRITYCPTPAAKVVFDYEIYNPEDGSVYATAHSVQVFMNKEYQLVWYAPDFYLKWKEQWQVMQ